MRVDEIEVGKTYKPSDDSDSMRRVDEIHNSMVYYAMLMKKTDRRWNHGLKNIKKEYGKTVKHYGNCWLKDFAAWAERRAG